MCSAKQGHSPSPLRSLVIAADPAPDGVVALRARRLGQIAAVDPAAAGRTADEVFGLILRLIAETFPRIFAVREVDHV